ncbi:EamA family transporter RarD [Streptomyces zingiberis]|uniref:EamA family transporter RarD n=1 Tax=Streptomyces zingiberis TaxID=2053010 RepID=UPI0028929C36|nr:EamA family transporter RarD [Streptomyces zingiberis]
MTPTQPSAEHRTGLLFGFAAYGIWGLFPLYWPLLEPAGAAEILAHRMVWSLVVMAVVMLVLRRRSWIRPLLRQPKRLGLIALAATAISANWGLYIWSVNSGHVVEAALGYFINPLVSIAFGVLLLRERLRPAQWVAVATGAVAVAVLTVGYGQLPWIALCLAFSFALYGLLKKHIGLDGLESLTAETTIQFLPALGFLFFLASRGDSTFTTQGTGHALLLATAGAVTALPLVCFGGAAVRLPLSTIGLLQYLTPLSQFVLGVTVFREEMPPERWAGFSLVWLALSILTWDALRTARRTRVQLRGARAAAAERAALPATALPAAEPPAAETAGTTAAEAALEIGTAAGTLPPGSGKAAAGPVAATPEHPGAAAAGAHGPAGGAETRRTSG